MPRPVLFLFSISGLLCSAEPALAPQPASADPEWSFVVAPYLQFRNIEVVNKAGVLPISYAELNYDDVFDNASHDLAIRGEAWRGRFGVMLDVSYLDLEGSSIDSIPINDGGGVTSTRSLDIASEQLVVDALVAYGFSPDPLDRWEIYGGIRYWDLKTDMTARLAGVVDASRSYAFDNDWVDPVIGFRGTSRLNAQLYLTGWFDLGGGLYGAEWSSSSAIYLGWKAHQHLHVLGGFRSQYVYYDNGENGADMFIYENFTYGPVIAIAAPF